MALRRCRRSRRRRDDGRGVSAAQYPLARFDIRSFASSCRPTTARPVWAFVRLGPRPPPRTSAVSSKAARQLTDWTAGYIPTCLHRSIAMDGSERGKTLCARLYLPTVLREPEANTASRDAWSNKGCELSLVVCLRYIWISLITVPQRSLR